MTLRTGVGASSGSAGPETALPPGPCLVVEAGSTGYDVASGLQKRLHRQVVAGALPGVLLLLEHPHVFTLGRRGRTDDILADTRTGAGRSPTTARASSSATP